MKAFTASYSGRTPSDILRSKSSMLAVWSAPPAAMAVTSLSGRSGARCRSHTAQCCSEPTVLAVARRPAGGRQDSSPGTDAADALGSGPYDETWWRVVNRRELHVWTKVDVGQALQQLRSAARFDARSAVDDQVVVEPVLVATSRFERQRHSRVTPDVPKLLLRIAQVRRDDLVAIHPNPHDGDLGRAVW